MCKKCPPVASFPLNVKKITPEKLNWLDQALKDHEDHKKAVPPLKECASGVCNYVEFTNDTICPDCGAELKIY